MSTLTIGNRTIGADAGCYVIAEAGSNHDGNFDQALSLIDTAARAGADAVKFQLFRARELYPENCGVVELPNGEHDFFEMLTNLEMPRQWMSDLNRRGTDLGIDVLYTPFDIDAVDLLAASAAPALKIASPELTHLPLLRHVAKSGIPTVLSTGMSSLGDIEEALTALGDPGAAVALLHCTTAYPCPPEDANIGVIPLLRQAFDHPVGLSDHTSDPVAAPLAAVALGGSIVEKHFTLSRDLDGPDHSYAVEPDELAEMINAVRSLEHLTLAERHDAARAHIGDTRFEVLTGSGLKVTAQAEAEMARCDRRALHAISDISAGSLITDDNMAVLRGERNLRPGLHPRYFDAVNGAMAQRAIPAGAGIEWADVIDRANP